MPILLFISLFTLVDFVLLFTVGSHIGLLSTLALVLGTGFIGLHLIRKEGVSTLARARQRMQSGELPSQELFTGAALIFGGALLLAPGFLSDALGLACLMPNARQLMLKALTWIGLTSAASQQQTNYEQSDTPRSSGQEEPIEGEFISREETARRR
ncbi:MULTISPECIES: FxsA family protein [Vreelandella]|uniref:FxsA family protein n=2 Tax=Vreelandella TaxID=3137766 RepID=A0A7C9JT52_9GAMM|nr:MULTISPECIES: FxsA family protein [Halomonas]NDL70543.1 FxsA family protein [Halomonas alkaliphila]NYS43766.1 FxsA family protein [Halomonas zhaodongensis]